MCSNLVGLVLLHLALGVSSLPGEAAIFQVFPRSGSLGGNTEITILGAGFERGGLEGL